MKCLQKRCRKEEDRDGKAKAKEEKREEMSKTMARVNDYMF